MTSLWISLFFLSFAWVFLLPVYTPCHWLGGLFVALGAVFSLLALRKERIAAMDRRYALLLVPLVPASILIPFPYNLGLILVSAGLVVGCLHRRTSSPAMAAIIAGGMLAVQSAALPLYLVLATHYHKAGIAAPVANMFLRMLGLHTGLADNIIHVRAGTELLALSTSWEKLAPLPLLGILAGGIPLMLCMSTARRRAGLFILAILVYVIIRYAALTLAYIDTGKENIFWVPAALIISFAPLFLVLVTLFPLRRTPELPRLDPGAKHWVLAGVTFVCIFSIVGVWGYRDPGATKQGKIIIDEKHSNWESTTEEYDTTWYGERSGYNYYSLYQYLGHYYSVDRSFDTLDDSLLSGYDILIIKTPTAGFSGEEVDSIERFVDNGGGLFLVGDHTNVFGMSTYLNPVAQRFGMRFNYDATYELNTGALSEYIHPEVMPHPIVQNLPPFLFATSCTLEAPLTADSVITGYGLKALGADYSQKNFFPADTVTSEMEFGLFTQAAAVKHGNGRVVAFADSTVFSNFWMFMPGKPELALGTMEWLNRQNSRFDYRIPMLGLALAALLPLAYLTIGIRAAHAALIILSVGSLAVSAGTCTCQALARAAYGLPQPQDNVTTVCFDKQHSAFAVPDRWEGFLSPPDQAFHTFFVWSQRLGYVPSVEPSLDTALRNGDIVIMINPDKPLTIDSRLSMMDFVNRGGKLLVLDGSSNQGSTSNEILQVFDMQIDFAPVGEGVARYSIGTEVRITSEACSVSGGRPLLLNDTGDAILSVAPVGEGLVAVFADSHMFCDGQLGSVGSIPTEGQLQISNLEFWMLGGLAASSFDGAAWGAT